MKDDRPEPAPWAIQPEAQVAVLLEEARRLVLEGETEAAVGLAEELLDHDPDDIEALLLIAEAAPRYGHGEVGVLAARQARARGADPGAAEAAALYAACELDAALAAAEARIATTPTDARAHAVRGMVLEVLGRLPEADAALAHAHTLRPAAYPLPLAVPAADWEPLLLEALSQLESGEREALRGWTFRWHPAPALDLLTTSHPPIPPTTCAVVSVDDAGGVTCDLFTRNLARGCADEAELVSRLAQALRDEAAHLDA